jgi:2-amino-4-hydroxy-6-hydroxymethyldihydropteridine diphosphokinase
MTERTAYIGIGSNLGDRKNFIDKALEMTASTGQVELCRLSNIIETIPLASTEQPKYLNAVAELKTTLSAVDLHKALGDIENKLGRARRGQWWPRTIDLDLLLFGKEIIDSPDLSVPHPQMHLRSFVLDGLCQLNGGLIHPVMGVSLNELNARLNGCNFALDPDRPQIVSIGGNIGVGKTTLAKKLAYYFGCKLLLEPYDENPFMPDVYAGKKELALDSQLYFLTSRIKQLDRNNLESGRICIGDYIFDKELIYARRLLDAQQLALYEKIYTPLAEQITAPALVIYMYDSAQNCLQRIRSRNRPYEQQIELQFLRSLDCDYKQLFKQWKSCPVIRVSTSQSTDADYLANQIKYYIAGHFTIASATEQSKM